MSPRAPLLAAVLAVVPMVLTGCQTPEGSPDGYRGEAAITLRAASSEVATARLALTALLRHGTFTRAADDTVTTSEQTLSGVVDTFTSLQPPPGADDVRQLADDALSRAQDALAQGRIAVRRHDHGQLTDALAAVAAAGEDLDRAHDKLVPGEPR